MRKKDSDHATHVVSAHVETAVPKSVFDVSNLPLQQAIEAWKGAMATANDISFHTPPKNKLPTRMDAWHMGEAFLAMLETISQDYKRSRYHIGRGGGDCYAVHFIPDGTIYLPIRDQYVRPGDMFVRDKAEPLTFRTSAHSPNATYHSLGFIIPKRLLDPFLEPTQKQDAMIYDGRLPLVTLLRQHLYTFKRQISDMTLPQAQTIIQPTVELLGAAMNGTITETNINAINNAVIKQIQQYIDANIENPKLSVTTIAATFQISTRKLYQLFEPFGGVLSYIQKKRLNLVHEAIVDPLQRNRRIQEIAESYGFLHRKNFNAAFRRLYGLTPREARAYAAEGRSRNIRQANATQDCWNWILTLR